MSYTLGQLKPGSKLVLQLTGPGSSQPIEVIAIVTEIKRDNLITIDINYNDKLLNFNNVNIDALYYRNNDLPIVWSSVQVVYHKVYRLASFTDGKPLNRRGCFRVGVDAPVTLERYNGKRYKSILKDLSLSGFAVYDKEDALNLKKNEPVKVYLEDNGFDMNLVGKCVRASVEESGKVYGFIMEDVAKELSTYITNKSH